MSRGILSRRATAKPASTIISKQTQTNALKEMEEGNKILLTEVMNQGDLLKYGMTNQLSPQIINTYSAYQLYELAYGGSIDYWKSPVFGSERSLEDEFVSDLIREVEVVESVYDCPVCRYNRILVRQEQKGSGDESMTALFRCTRCGYGWVNSGRG
jgi:DNA-directed RNA polymerase subunit M/transcription elongation factor TFIIS